MPTIGEVARTSNWWNWKIPPVLAVSMAAALIFGVSPFETWLYLAVILFTGMCAGTYGHLINDIFDLDADRRAGKPNVMDPFRPWQRVALCAVTVAGGFLPALLVPYSLLSLTLLAAEFLVPTLYSAPPVRWKERGWWGVLADSLGAHGIPAAYVISMMSLAPTAGPRRNEALAFAAAIPLWALATGLKNIIGHQVQDAASDQSAGVVTYATQAGPEPARAAATRSLSCEIALLALSSLALVRTAPLVPITVALFFASRGPEVWRAFGTAGLRLALDALLHSLWTTNRLYESYLPMAAAIHLALSSWLLAPIPFVLAAVFRDNYRYCWNDWEPLANRLRGRHFCDHTD